MTVTLTATQINNLDPAQRRHLLTHLNTRPLTTPAGDREIVRGELTAWPADHGGWRIQHTPTGLWLDIAGNWVDASVFPEAAWHADYDDPENEMLWADVELALAYAQATL